MATTINPVGSGGGGYFESSPFSPAPLVVNPSGGMSPIKDAPKVNGSGGADSNYGEPVRMCPLNKQEPPVLLPLYVRLSFFFDGTLNNRSNVNEGPQKHKGQDSYTNGMSNVAKMETAGVSRALGIDVHITVYIEGIGTADGEDDATRGYALGTGPTGVDKRVDKGIMVALERISVETRGRPIAELYVDAFGFSRGAAAARFCVWKCMTEKGATLRDRLLAMNKSVGNVEMKFVGLYDTVASYGTDHDDDTNELHLDSLSVAACVVQLAAAEEHRENFQLTDIASAGVRGKQIFLPGVHSDVGGGYAAIEDEVGIQLLDFDIAWLGANEKAAIQRDREWLVNSGWYYDNEISEANAFNEVKATRRGIVNTYSRIPLKIMADFARESGVLIKDTLEDTNPIPDALSTARDELLAYSRRGLSDLTDWFHTNPGLDLSWHKSLRHEYLHFSSFYGLTLGANDPQWSTGNIVTGRRQRKIQPG